MNYSTTSKQLLFLNIWLQKWNRRPRFTLVGIQLEWVDSQNLGASISLKVTSSTIHEFPKTPQMKDSLMGFIQGFFFIIICTNLRFDQLGI